jgi:carboxyl-terminal processing protease
MRNFFSTMAMAFVVVAVINVAPASAAKTDKSEIYRLLELFGDVFERVRTDYVEETTEEELVEAAIQGMLQSLDPHSSYLNKKTFKDMRVQTKGEFGGLGIEVTMESGYVKVVSPIDDTPAFRAGIEPGDLITHLDGKHIQGLTLSEAVEKMRGKVGTDIVLTVRRKDVKPLKITITRDKIRIRSVRSRVEGDIGYLRITNFSEQTKIGVTKSIAKLREEIGEDVRGFVIDLRNNPGGLLDQAVSVSDAFLDRGEIVSTRGREVSNAQRFQARPGDLAAGLPIVVLINGGSASASEIVAGALQDHKRAIILGTRSFGKGSVQTIIPLGASGAMKLTTQRYYTPSGRSIQAKGIDPDIIVEQSRVEPLRRGPTRKEADLRRSLRNEDKKDNKPKEAAPEKSSDKKPVKAADEPSKKAEKTEKKPERPFDYQLVRALDLIRGISLYNRQAAN